MSLSLLPLRRHIVVRLFGRHRVVLPRARCVAEDATTTVMELKP